MIFMSAKLANNVLDSEMSPVEIIAQSLDEGTMQIYTGRVPGVSVIVNRKPIVSFDKVGVESKGDMVKLKFGSNHCLKISDACEPKFFRFVSGLDNMIYIQGEVGHQGDMKDFNFYLKTLHKGETVCLDSFNMKFGPR